MTCSPLAPRPDRTAHLLLLLVLLLILLGSLTACRSHKVSTSDVQQIGQSIEVEKASDESHIVAIFDTTYLRVTIFDTTRRDTAVPARIIEYGHIVEKTETQIFRDTVHVERRDTIYMVEDTAEKRTRPPNFYWMITVCVFLVLALLYKIRRLLI